MSKQEEVTENGGDSGVSPAVALNGKSTDSNRKDICRDFLNKICNRGTRCKFYHPPSEEAASEKRRDDFSFCIDYQNQGCFRENCRFVHAPGQDVDNYKKTGDISNVLARAIAAVTKQDNINGIPFCKEFQSNRCTRGQRCRYWHVNVEAERERRKALIATGGGAGGMDPSIGGASGRYAPQLRPQPMLGSRRRPAADSPGDFLPPKRGGFGPGMSPLGGYPPAAPPPLQPDPYFAQLERENAELRRELDTVRREVQRERDRYDSLLAVINPSMAQQQQIQQQHQSSPYGTPNLHPLNQSSGALQSQPVHPVPPPQQTAQKWGSEIKAPDWY